MTPGTSVVSRPIVSPSRVADPTVNLMGLDRFRLEWLVSFVAVARYGGVLAAARVLYRSQPRVSCHITSLEHALGTTLLDRSIRPVAVTPEGAALLAQAEKVITGIRLLADAAHGYALIAGNLQDLVAGCAAQ